MNRGQLISKEKIINAIDAANVHFLWCWEKFQKLRRHHVVLQDLIDFQVRLAAAFAILDETYRLIKAEQKRLIKRKARYEQSWFVGRMAKLDLYLKAVKEAIGIGRSLGDGFAWIFYRGESALLDEHAGQQRQLLLPPNIGGIGERAFIEKLQGLGGMFVIYHAITSFLRLGDVSFFDPTLGKITGIGELKTRHIEGDRYNITLGFVTGDLENSILKQDKPAGSDPTYEPLDIPIQRKFNKQLDQLGKVFEKRIKVDNNPRIKISGRFHFDILDRVLCRRSAVACEWEKAGRGLMLGAWHPRRQESLGKRLLQPAGNTEMILRAVTDAAAKILDPQFQDNCLFVGNLGSHETGFPITPWGGIPMLWWPLREQQIHDLIFGHVMVVTLFNPAQLWEILRKRGFEVIQSQPSRVLKLTKKIRRKRLDVKNFSYFENLTPYALMDENAVADMIDAWVEQAAVAAGDRSAKIFMRPHLISTFVKAPTSIP